MKLIKKSILASATLCLFPFYSFSADWVAVTDQAELTKLFTETTMSATLTDNVKAKATYNAGGTGELSAWGDIFKREWKIENAQACLKKNQDWQCLTVEKRGEQYRATDSKTGEKVEFTVSGQNLIADSVNKTNEGGPAAPSADEMAKKLANPNSPLATLNFKAQYRQFDGDLPNANKQSSTTILFQPSFPFSLDNGDLIFFRPGIPLIIDQPIPTADGQDFEGETGLGDIGFDLAYGVTTKTGWAIAGGMVASLPTATDDNLGTNKFSAGPELLVAKLGKNYVLGAYPNHMWDVAGSGDKDISLTSAQFFGIWLPGGGWNVGTSPIFSYDHINDQATLPVNLTLGKTLIFDGTPWKMSIEFNYYVERNDAISPTWMIGFNFGPVVKNVFAQWLQ